MDGLIVLQRVEEAMRMVPAMIADLHDDERLGAVACPRRLGGHPVA